MKWQKLLAFSCFWLFAGGLFAQIDVDLNDYTICEGESLQIVPVVSGGDGEYTYSWSPSIGLSCADCLSPTLDSPAPGNYIYELTVEDGSGASITVGTNITVAPIPEIIANVSQITCNGGNDGLIVLQGTGDLVAYNWSNGSTTPVQQGLSAGTYCVTVVSSFGCEADACIDIDEAPSLWAEINGPSVIECPNQEVNLFAFVTGGVAPYAFSWSLDGVTIATTVDLTIDGSVLNNSVLELHVIDANGCNIQQVYFVDVALEASIAGGAITYLDCISGMATLDASASTQGADIEYSWVGPGGFTSDEAIVSVSVPGTYFFSATNTTESNCLAQAQVEVRSYTDELNIELDPVLTACNTYELSYVPAIQIPTLQQTWTFPDGSTQAGTTITTTETGLYQLTIQLTEAGCAFTESIFIDTEVDACGTIEGSINWITNEFCIDDGSATPLSGWLVTATASGGSTFNTFTDENGNYDLFVPVGEYTVVPSPPNSAWEGCSDAAVVLVQTTGTIGTADFLYERVVNCPELAVSLNTQLLRRCFESFYNVSVCNQGTEAALQPEAVLILDDYLTYVSTNQTGVSVNGQVVSWALPDLAPGECHSFWVKVLVSCDAEIGQVHCSELFATPDSLCVPVNPEWSGANLELSSECEGGQINFRVTNTGEGDLTEPVQYIIIEDGVVLMDEPGQLENLVSTGEETFPVPANGSTYTFEIMQAPNHPYTTYISASVEGCGTNEQGGFSTGFATQFAQQTATPASVVFCEENVGSWDPNDKNALPVGYGEQHYIVPETEINYRIRFQNTGTDTAFTVVIRDTLSEDLDLTTFRPGTSSHDYELDIDGERTLTFTFNDILLVDSTTNLEASQGYVYFKIKPVVSTPLETVIENRAAIYFDFNEPVITNTVFHTLGRDFFEVVNWTDISGAEIQLNMYPNPVTDLAWLQLSGELSDQKEVLVQDALGRTMLRQRFSGEQTELDLRQLPAGWYTIQLTDDQGTLIGTGKLVKR